jgi:hypothetical protein
MDAENHMRENGCAPFPVGPRIPRRNAALPALVASPATRRRVVAAFAVMDLDLGAVEERIDGSEESSNTKSPLWRQVRSAIVEWFGRHARGTDGPLDESGLLDAMYFIAHPGAQTGAGAELRQKIAGLQGRPRKHDRAGSFTPFGLLHYSCRCGCAQPALASSEWNVESEDQMQALRVTLQAGDGQWKLLAGMFLKLIHGHLAVLPNRHYTPRSQRYAAIVRILDAIVWHQAPEHAGRMVPLAASLHLQLEQMAPFLASERGDDTWVLDFDALPHCFNPFLLESEATAVAQAQRLLAVELNRPDAASWVDDAADLAREVASLATDPLSAPTLQFTTGELGKLAARYASDNKKRELLPNDAVGGHAGELEAIVLRRLPALRSYTNWMHDRGLELVVTARQALAPDAGASR